MLTHYRSLLDTICGDDNSMWFPALLSGILTLQVLWPGTIHDLGRVVHYLGVSIEKVNLSKRPRV